VRLLSSSRLMSATQITDKVRHDLTVFGEPGKLADDLTCVVVKTSVRTPPLSMQAHTQITGGLADLPKVRAFVDDFYRSNAQDMFAEEEFQEFRAAIEAVLAGIVQHGYTQLEQKPVWISVYTTDDEIHARLSHVGSTLDVERCSRTEAADGVDRLEHGMDEMGRHYVLIRKRKTTRGGKEDAVSRPVL
jgi:hypothetical protein